MRVDTGTQHVSGHLTLLPSCSKTDLADLGCSILYTLLIKCLVQGKDIILPFVRPSKFLPASPEHARSTQASSLYINTFREETAAPPYLTATPADLKAECNTDDRVWQVTVFSSVIVL